MNAPNVIPFNPNTFEGIVPTGYDIVVYEKNEDPNDGLVLYGFDELGMFEEEFNSPCYCFLK